MSLTKQITTCMPALTPVLPAVLPTTEIWGLLPRIRRYSSTGCAAGQYSCYLNWRYNQVSVAKGPLFDDMLLLLGMKVRFHVENVLPRPVD
jgi:hypothetical protein